MLASIRRLGAALVVALALLLTVGQARAVEVPTLTQYATDLTGTLSAQQLATLNTRLAALHKTKGAQLVVLVVPTTQPDDIETWSLAVAEKNAIGRKGSDDGVLLLVVKNDRRARIEVGSGLEGAIPDAACARILREYLGPKLRQGDLYGGIQDAVGVLSQLIDGEALPPPVDATPRHAAGPSLGNLLMIGVFVALFLRGVLGRAPKLLRAPVAAVVNGGVLWLLAQSLGVGLLGAAIGAVLLLLPGGGGNSIGGGGWGGFGGFGGWGGGGGGFGGGGGGGGFSGGGGGFSGGGASGSW